VHDRAIPSIKAGELLVRVEAVALNSVDWKIQKYGAFITEYPTILGSDGAGIVEEVGAGVSGFAKRDRV
jgi:NADPH:quinone reductase-like Zn-dependent oxidoreductase